VGVGGPLVAVQGVRELAVRRDEDQFPLVREPVTDDSGQDVGVAVEGVTFRVRRENDLDRQARPADPLRQLTLPGGRYGIGVGLVDVDGRGAQGLGDALPGARGVAVPRTGRGGGERGEQQRREDGDNALDVSGHLRSPSPCR
jgi:hypothetical protein